MISFKIIIITLSNSYITLLLIYATY